ncbi:hypothetical protein CRENBAI_000606 [Crenichthys baileyi]|uniref:Hexosyltransferase n=1 Tax=Crenichthys baileyi TaxID=28760 RepID=A0AAV9RZB3_9TELE
MVGPETQSLGYLLAFRAASCRSAVLQWKDQAAHLHHRNVSPKPSTQQQRRDSSWVTQQMLKPETTRQAPPPYVSPGPYLVEYPYDTRCTCGTEKLVHGQVVRLFFLLGTQTGDNPQQVHQQLLQESKDHHDLIQSNFVDCYKNLTIKTMVMLEWLNSFCSNTTYAMKIDSDMFLNVPNLVTVLLNAPRTNYMTSLVAHGGRVSRNPKSKFYVAVDILSDPVYPLCALGLGYVVSLDLTKKLIEAARHVKALYIEDVYLGLCMRHLGIRPTDPPNRFYFHVFPIKYNRCGYSKIIATTTREKYGSCADLERL